MSLPATESFTGTNGTSPPNANWTNKTNGIQIQSNYFSGTNAAVCGAFWDTDAFNDKHYAKVTYVSAGEFGHCVGPAIRIATNSDDSLYYCNVSEDGYVYNGQLVTGEPTDWDAGLTAPATGSVVEITVDATTSTTIIYKVDGSTVFIYTLKNALSGGAAGVCGYLDSARGDDWEGGDVGVSTYTVNVSDGVTVGESKTVTLPDALAISKSENVILGESVDADLAVPWSVNVTDTASLSEIVTIVLPDVLILSASDGLTLGEDKTVSVESIGTLSVNESDSISVTDGYFYGWTDLAISINEGMTVGETVTVGAPDPKLLSITENVTLGETAAVQLEAVPDRNISVTDNLTLGDTPTASMSELGILIDPSVLSLWTKAVEVV